MEQPFFGRYMRFSSHSSRRIFGISSKWPTIWKTAQRSASLPIRSMDVVVAVKRQERVIDLRLRTVVKPNPDVALLLSHLILHLPKGSKLAQNVVEKIA